MFSEWISGYELKIISIWGNYKMNLYYNISIISKYIINYYNINSVC